MIRSGVGKTRRIRAADPQGVYRAVLNALLNDGNTVADYRADTGVTGALAVSSWANQLGSAPALAQGTGANQPIYLPFSGSKYGYLPGVAGNYFSTPSAAANQVAAITDFLCYVAADSWTPGSSKTIFGKWTSLQLSYALNIGTGGQLTFFKSLDGSANVSVNTSASDGGAVLSAGLSNGVGSWILVRMTSASVSFYKADASSSPPSAIGGWTQVGVTQTISAGAPFASSAVLEVGSTGAGTAPGIVGKAYRLLIYSGQYDNGGTLKGDFNPESAAETTTNGATWTASTGEVWTLNNTGAVPAQVVSSAQIFANGTAHYLTTGAFTLNQPCTMYFVGRQNTWTNNDALWDGVHASCNLSQNTASPQIAVFSGGGFGATNSDWTLKAKNVVIVTHNGASTTIQVGSNAASTSASGSGNPGGLYLFVERSLAAFANASCNEFIVRNGADSAATRALIYQYLKAIHGTP